MPKLKPSGYITADESTTPGYLAKQMKKYRAMVEEQKKKDAAIKAEVQAKVRKLGSANQ